MVNEGRMKASNKTGEIGRVTARLKKATDQLKRATERLRIPNRNQESFGIDINVDIHRSNDFHLRNSIKSN